MDISVAFAISGLTADLPFIRIREAYSQHFLTDSTIRISPMILLHITYPGAYDLAVALPGQSKRFPFPARSFGLRITLIH
jgi:hypothetical protein